MDEEAMVIAGLAGPVSAAARFTEVADSTAVVDFMAAAVDMAAADMAGSVPFYELHACGQDCIA
jgi:hypothetical protein